MRKYSYTLIVDDISNSTEYYKKHFSWTVKKESDSFVIMETESPLIFSMVRKEYLYQNLNIDETEIPDRSFCTWIYDSEKQLLDDKQELLNKGMVQIGTIGNFLKGKDGKIWELRKEGDII